MPQKKPHVPCDREWGWKDAWFSEAGLLAATEDRVRHVGCGFILQPDGLIHTSRGKTDSAVAALGHVLKNTPQAEPERSGDSRRQRLPHRLPGQLAVYDASFQPAYNLSPPTQGVALG